MSDRITVHLDEATSDAELRVLAAEVAVAFNIAEEEARSLLEADVIILEGRQAEKLVAICRDLGVNGTLSKPPRRARARFYLPRYALPFTLGVLVTAFLVAVIALAPFSAQPSAGESEPAEPLSVPVVGPAREEATTSEVPSVPTSEVSESGALTPEPTTPVISSLPVAEETTSAEATDELTTEAPEISLFTVARDGDLAQVRAVLDGALEVDSRDAYGQTPLMYAAGANRAEVVAALLDAGARVEAQSDAGWTALMYAARNLAYPNVTAVLIEAGADLQALNADGQTARDIAVANNNPEAAGQLDVEHTQRAEAVEERETAQTVVQSRVGVETATRVEAPLPISVSPRPARGVTVPPNPPAPSTARAITVSARPSPVPAPETTGDAPRTGYVLSNAQIEDQRQLVTTCLQNWDTCGTD